MNTSTVTIGQQIKSDWARLTALISQYGQAVGAYGQLQGNVGADASTKTFYQNEIVRLRNLGAGAQLLSSLTVARDTANAALNTATNKAQAQLKQATAISADISATVKEIENEYLKLIEIKDKELFQAIKLVRKNAEKEVAVARNGLPNKIIFSRSLAIAKKKRIDEKNKATKDRIIKASAGVIGGAAIGGLPGAVVGLIIGTLGGKKNANSTTK